MRGSLWICVVINGRIGFGGWEKGIVVSLLKIVVATVPQKLARTVTALVVEIRSGRGETYNCVKISALEGLVLATRG